jgi:hypothetical protein
METCQVSAQKSADGIVVQILGRRPERGKEEGQFYKLRDGNESDTDEPYSGALWKIAHSNDHSGRSSKQ